MAVALPSYVTLGDVGRSAATEDYAANSLEVGAFKEHSRQGLSFLMEPMRCQYQISQSPCAAASLVFKAFLGSPDPRHGWPIWLQVSPDLAELSGASIPGDQTAVRLSEKPTARPSQDSLQDQCAGSVDESVPGPAAATRESLSMEMSCLNALIQGQIAAR